MGIKGLTRNDILKLKKTPQASLLHSFHNIRQKIRLNPFCCIAESWKACQKSVRSMNLWRSREQKFPTLCSLRSALSQYFCPQQRGIALQTRITSGLPHWIPAGPSVTPQLPNSGFRHSTSTKRGRIWRIVLHLYFHFKEIYIYSQLFIVSFAQAEIITITPLENACSKHLF